MAEAQHAYAITEHLSNPYWSWRFRLLCADLLIEQGHPADEYAALLAKDPPLGFGSSELSARIALSRGHAAQVSRKYGEAEVYYGQALQHSAAIPDRSWIAEVLTRRASLFLEEEKLDEAAVDVAKALPLAESSGDNYLLTSLLALKGESYFRRYRYSEAILAYQSAVTIADGKNLPFLMPLLLGNLALCYYWLGDSAQALEYLARTEAFYQRNPKPDDEQIDIGTRAKVYALSQDYPNAVKTYERALKIAIRVGDKHRQGEWLDDLTTVYLQAENLTAAENANRQALKVINAKDEPYYFAFAELNSARLLRARNQPVLALKKLQTLQQFKSGNQTDAPELAWEIRAEMARVFAALNDVAAARREFSASLDKTESTRNAISDDWQKITFFAQVLGLYRAYIDFLIDHGDITGALRVAESCHARLLTEKLGSSSEEHWDFQKTARLKGAVILSYWVAAKRSFLWVTTASSTECFILPGESELASKIRAHNQQIQELYDLTASPGSPANSLYDILIAPAAAKLEGAAHVIVVPDGPLGSLNFETLVSVSSSPRYWLNAASVSMAPSLAFLLPQKQRAFQVNAALLVGAPTGSDPDFPVLPGAKRELDAIAALFSQRGRITLLAGPEATPQRFREARPGSFSLIHVAAHAVANRESPLDSAIILAGNENYRLYARDLQKMDLRVDLVTLSACRTAGTRTFPSGGLVGFSWVLLHSGAQN
ncbi:MAG: CHAT domain-containing protein, partial [Acidobacteriaceae bacterium]|nr:CHAT domain-containing protein [Acidobacteriaceae bacterium]